VQALGAVAERDAAELAVRRAQRPFTDALDQRFVAAAVLDQVRDGADLQAVLLGEHLQVRQAGHGAVVVHDLADHRGRRQARHARQVAAGFGVAGAHQHAAVLGLQREDVARLHQVARLGVLGHRDLHGAGAVGGRDAGGHAGGRLDRDGERGAVLGAVACGHGRQLQLLAALARERQADQPAAVLGHEVDRFGRDMVRGEDQVAFVFTVFFVDEDDHPPGGELGDDLGNR